MIFMKFLSVVLTDLHTRNPDMYLQNYYGYNGTTYCWPSCGPLSQYYTRPNRPIPRPLKRRNGIYYIGPVRRPPWGQAAAAGDNEENGNVEDDCHDNNNSYNNNSSNSNNNNNKDSTPLMMKKKRNVGNNVDDRRGEMTEIHGEHSNKQGWGACNGRRGYFVTVNMGNVAVEEGMAARLPLPPPLPQLPFMSQPKPHSKQQLVCDFLGLFKVSFLSLLTLVSFINYSKS